MRFNFVQNKIKKDKKKFHSENSSDYQNLELYNILANRAQRCPGKIL